ncbi:uncharacterized protein LOC127250008 [Andrographis paniculata]|uniref:uncharacterized protein LOC127250008 n=1 Tax=Andrographis paniculata TaxID=175694 RepID=UPI0021E76B08|nr:uncharacterized protein LOC127250008 [Andrographis paniculata]XP_051129105.1 uncharacterized protein LOC127250008 [Andrographis paniculata]
MASACVNNIGRTPESFLDCTPAKFSSYGWLSPRISISREFPEKEGVKGSVTMPSPKNLLLPDDVEKSKPEGADPESSAKDFVDFEFRLEDPVTMLPADELFSDGKLVPLQFTNMRNTMTPASASSDVRSQVTPKFRHRCEISSTDPYLFSPKAPRCSTRWKELLGLKKMYQTNNSKQEDLKMAVASLSSHRHNRNAARSLKHLLNRSSKSPLITSTDSSLSLPLLPLKDSENESVSISSRLSLSSSSSGHEHDDLPRLSLDSEKPKSVARNTHQNTNSISRVRLSKHKSTKSSENATANTRAGRSPIRKAPESTLPVRGVSVDSPRMNSSGKIVFYGLERSSSSPSSFNGGPKHRHRGMERSYSANVRVTPVLNVPVCSLRGSSKSGVFGLPLFSSPQKKESGGCGGVGTKNQSNHGRNRT